MRYVDIKRHLQPFSISNRRKTTINHAFASAVAPCDRFEDEVVKSAIRVLGQDPDAELVCVYCGKMAETWDHVFATVKASVFSGAGHRLGNLVPCCKPCNSSKGNKQWIDYLRTLNQSEEVLVDRIAVIQRYLDQYFVVDAVPADLPEYRELLEIKTQIIELMERADALATKIREDK